MTSEISRRGVLGGAAAIGAAGLGGVSDLPGHPASALAQGIRDNHASTARRAHIGTPTSRVDGRAKVTGAAKYAAEHNASSLALGPDLAYGYVVTSRIAKGRIAGIDTSQAKRVAGVIDVLTHEHRPRMAD